MFTTRINDKIIGREYMDFDTACDAAKLLCDASKVAVIVNVVDSRGFERAAFMPAPVAVERPRTPKVLMPCYCDSAYHPQGC